MSLLERFYGGSPSYPSQAFTGILPLAEGGTGAALTDPNADRILFWDDSAGGSVWLSMGSNISITGTTLNAVGATGITWAEVVGTSQAIAVNSGYVANNGSLVSLSLPASSAVGDIIEVCGKGAGGWRITQAVGQSINVGASSTTSGVTGSVSSSIVFNSIRLLCTVANTVWTALSHEGTLTIA